MNLKKLFVLTIFIPIVITASDNAGESYTSVFALFDPSALARPSPLACANQQTASSQSPQLHITTASIPASPSSTPRSSSASPSPMESASAGSKETQATIMAEIQANFNGIRFAMNALHIKQESTAEDIKKNAAAMEETASKLDKQQKELVDLQKLAKMNSKRLDTVQHRQAEHDRKLQFQETRLTNQETNLANVVAHLNLMYQPPAAAAAAAPEAPFIQVQRRRRGSSTAASEKPPLIRITCKPQSKN